MLDKIFRKDRKGFMIVLLVYIVLVIADFISTIRFGQLAHYLEINPLYKYVGLSGLVILNMLVIWGFYYFYNRKSLSINRRFLIILVLVVFCFFRLFVVFNNVVVAEDPPTIEEAMQVTQEQKTEYFQMYFLSNIMQLLLPYLLGWIAYMLFQMDHIIQKKWPD